jgi:Raf kinase inhibitor-like YbhB/YbcL family protein
MMTFTLLERLAGRGFAGRRVATLVATCAAFAAASVLGTPGQAATKDAAQGSSSPRAAAGAFTLTSPEVVNEGRIGEPQVFNSFGCHGGNVSPALSWRNAPEGTRSFALLLHDPDAPTGSGWWHWVVYNIPGDATSLAADAGDPKKNLMPAGVAQGRTDFGTPGYGGPCPPAGKPHHYWFRLYALKVPKLDVPADASPAMIAFNVHANSIGKAELVGLYGR